MRRLGRGWVRVLPWIIVLSLLAGCVTAFYLRDYTAEIFRADYTFYVTPNADGTYAGDPVRLARECQLLTQTDSFQKAVLENVPSDGHTRVLVEAVNRTYMLEVSAVGPDRQIVCDLANAVGDELVDWLPRTLQAKKTQSIQRAELPDEPYYVYRNAYIAAVTVGVFAVLSLLAGCMPSRRRPLSFASVQADVFCLGAVHDTRKRTARYLKKSSKKTSRSCTLLEGMDRFIREDVRQLALMLRTSGTKQKPGSYLFAALTDDDEDAAVVALLSSELAQQGFRVLLVEMDAQRRQLGRLLDVQATADLCDCMKGRAALSDAMMHTSIPNLSFVDALHPEVPVASIAATSAFAEFMKKVQGHFDFVFVHASPRNETTDAATLSLTTASTILLARDEKYALEEIEAAARELVRLHKPAKGVIFTRV